MLHSLSLQLSACVGECLAQSVYLNEVLPVLATAAKVLLVNRNGSTQESVRRWDWLKLTSRTHRNVRPQPFRLGSSAFQCRVVLRQRQLNLLQSELGSFFGL